MIFVVLSSFIRAIVIFLFLVLAFISFLISPFCLFFLRLIIIVWLFVSVAANATKAALAGLATTEDLKKVSLQKASLSKVMNPGGTNAAPYKDLMLIQVKGRRHVEMRIVQPCSKSVNSGDCFLLVTKDKIYQWMGEFANVMERYD